MWVCRERGGGRREERGEKVGRRRERERERERKEREKGEREREREKGEREREREGERESTLMNYTACAIALPSNELLQCVHLSC